MKLQTLILPFLLSITSLLAQPYHFDYAGKEYFCSETESFVLNLPETEGGGIISADDLSAPNLDQKALFNIHFYEITINDAKMGELLYYNNYQLPAPLYIFSQGKISDLLKMSLHGSFCGKNYVFHFESVEPFSSSTPLDASFGTVVPLLYTASPENALFLYPGGKGILVFACNTTVTRMKPIDRAGKSYSQRIKEPIKILIKVPVVVITR